MKDPITLAWILFLLCVSTFGLGLTFGKDRGIKLQKIKAVEQGAAYWSANPDGTTTFVWKETNK